MFKFNKFGYNNLMYFPSPLAPKTNRTSSSWRGTLNEITATVVEGFK